ncbi:hypothetical protein MMB17_06410 [Methylobacterium organophilum]|uniref:hypothetical protein n=1 Tax=Methylobacterium organophilum TaxID=410 RepID=UPI001F148B0F|nr:hypothetical protein [Methylobacterium organophilum]UMY18932.1 hypothetical protein MMB17_06410 [Methylobacterium organophilum]
MDTLLFLLAGAALVAACAAFAVMNGRAKREPLRLPQEERLALDARDEDAAIDAIRPARESPIDRQAEILDLEIIDPEPVRRALEDHRAEGERTEREDRRNR